MKMAEPDDEPDHFTPEFLHLVADKLRPSDIIDYLDTLPGDVVEKILSLEKRDVKQANNLLLQEIIDAPEDDYEGLCNRFLFALQEEAYQSLIRDFQNQCGNSRHPNFQTEYLGFLFKLTRVDFIQKINPADLVPHLVHDGHLSHRDKITILGIQERTKQCQELFSVLERKVPEGMTVIYDILKEKYPELISKMDPGAQRDELERKGIIEREVDVDPGENEETCSEEEYNSDYEKFEEEESEKHEMIRKQAPIKLRKYQLELARHAIKGLNTIVCAETGSGKTWVALHITKEHLAHDYTGKAKVVFMARTNHLVRQQFSMFNKYLHEYQVFLLRRDNAQCVAMHELMNEVKVFFMTPQILLNNIKSGNVSITDFSLLFLDECHHTTEESPYFRLMMKYLRAKEKHPRPDLPQIVGMTATIGTGGADTVSTACDYMLEICANLDVNKISTVTENCEELEKFVSMPKQKFVKLGEKEIEPVKDVIENYMEIFENFIKNETTALNRRDVNLIWKRKPLHREGLRYLNWVNGFQKWVACIVEDDDTLARAINNATDYLQKYSSLLEINYLMDIEHVKDFAAKKFPNDLGKQDKNEMKLFAIFKDFLTELENMKNVRRPQNEYLKSLRAELANLANTEEFRGIVFVQTRATAYALSSHLDKELKYLGYNVAPLVGTVAKHSGTGMSETQKDEILDHFRIGKFNLLVATSVASEGIDIPKCNFVITYNVTGNEAKITQMSGRARAKDSVALHISDHSTLQKAQQGLARRALMEAACLELCRIPQEERQRCIDKIQEDKLRSNKLKELQELMKETKPTCEFHLKCFRCRQKVLEGNEIFLYEKQHRIVIDPNFFNRLDLVPIEDPIEIDGTCSKNVMYCKKCSFKWGTTFIIQGFEVPILRSAGFLFYINLEKKTSHFRKWRKFPYKLNNIERADFEKLMYSSIINVTK